MVLPSDGTPITPIAQRAHDQPLTIARRALDVDAMGVGGERAMGRQ